MSVRLSRPRTKARQVTAATTDRWRLASIGVLATVAIALFLLPLGIPPGSRVDLDRMNGLGLVSVLPSTSLGGVTLLAFAFLLTLALRRPHPILLGAELIALVCCLHGVAALVEPLPRFATAWQHAGFVEYIGRTGDTLPTLDARFNWPGFFALAAFAAAFLPDGTYLESVTPVLGIAPVAFNLCYVLAMLALLHRLRAPWRARWFAVWLATSANWVGQDYFSPQAEGYLIYLLFLAILLTWFRGDETPADPARSARRAVLLVLLIVLFAVLAASHQLTPILLLAACAGLVLARRCTLTGLPVLLGVVLVGWVSFMAMPYWSGHLATILGDIGRLGGNVSASVADRIGGNPQHELVQYIRLLVAATVLGFAVLGAVRRWFRGCRDRVALVLAAVPFTALGLQSYGGEIALRSYLFALPAACLLAAFAFFPAPGPPSRRAMGAAALCALVVVDGFFFARYGNERYERVRPGEVAAMEYVYRHDAAGARVVWLTPTPETDLTPNMPWGFRDMEKIDYLSARAPRDPTDVAALVERMRDLGPGTYLITTRGQEAYFELNHGFPPDWGDRFRARLAAAGDVEVATANPDAALYTLDWRPGATASPPFSGPDGPIVGRTPLTPLGLAVLPLLLGVLVARELCLLRLPRAERRRVRPMTLAAIPLGVIFLVVVAERLIVLS